MRLQEFISIREIRRSDLFLSFLVFVTVCAASLSEAAGLSERPTVEQITHELRSQDIPRILKSLENTYILPGDDELANFLYDLWMGKEKTHPDLPWDTVKSPQIRIRLTKILAFGVMNEALVMDRAELSDYAWLIISSEDEEVTSEAFSALAPLDNVEDVVRIESYLAVEKPGIGEGFYGAIWALSAMCNVQAGKLLDVLVETETDPQRNRIIVETRRQWDLEKTRIGLCR